MSLSRWKMMAGVLGVSIGGLAAAASQCPKFDSSKGRSPESPVAKAEPKLSPAGAPAPPAPAFEMPAAPVLLPAGPTPPAPVGGLPGTPSLPAAPAPMLPDMPKPPAATGGLPPLPDFPAGPAAPDMKPSKPAEAIHPEKTLPLSAPATPSAPADTKPLKLKPPTAQPFLPPTPNELIPPEATAPSSPMHAPKADPLPPAANIALPDNAGPERMIKPAPVVNTSGAQPASQVPSQPLPAMPSDAATLPPAVDVPLSKPTFTPAPAAIAPAVAETKFRIILRVGEGEPTFEVKNGDNLVLKVACEKVDIESVEKSNGLSKVTARGKVRFAGFGAEGSCDSLSFMAGTGEVSMTGDVKVQVKDKLGRVESELTTASMKYKIDASSVGGALKP